MNKDLLKVLNDRLDDLFRWQLFFIENEDKLSDEEWEIVLAKLFDTYTPSMLCLVLGFVDRIVEAVKARMNSKDIEPALLTNEDEMRMREQMQRIVTDKPDDLFEWFDFLTEYQYQLSESDWDVVITCLLDHYSSFVVARFLKDFDCFNDALNERVTDDDDEHEDEEGEGQ